ncbi:MAG: serine/threonine-protein kinase [Myxococcota bacterium]
MLRATGERSELRGTVLGGSYRVGACIGAGGTGLVFEARRLDDEALFAIKMLRPIYAAHTELCRRLRREREVSRSVRHSGIVPVVDEGHLTDGSPYLVMPRLRGESLAQLLRRVGILSSPETAAIGIRLASVLQSAHCRGFVHRDLKPEHVLLDRAPCGALDMHLIDFGVVASVTAPREERDGERGKIFGTPNYASPEQASGDPFVDGRSDLFSLGVLLFECVSGELPYCGDNVASLLRQIVLAEPPRVSSLAGHVDETLDRVIARAMSRSSEQRHPTARAIARDLRPVAEPQLGVERLLASRLRVGGEQQEQVETVRERVPLAVCGAPSLV